MYDAPEAQLACTVQFLRIFMFAVEEVPFFAVNLKSYGDELYVLFSSHVNWYMITLVVITDN